MSTVAHGITFFLKKRKKWKNFICTCFIYVQSFKALTDMVGSINRTAIRWLNRVESQVRSSVFFIQNDLD